MKGKMLLGKAEGQELYLPVSALKKHFISIGSTGSGKTVLSKVLIEEAALAGIPSIIIDPHGDLASLAIPGERKVLGEKGLSQEQAEKLKKIPVNIFTPASRSGLPLSVSPLEIHPNEEDKVDIVDQTASAMTSLLGYDLSSDKGSSTKGVLYTVLMERDFARFEELIEYLEDPNIQKKLKALATESQIKEITRKLTLLTIGKSAQLFEPGYKLNLDQMLAKPSINIVYLNTLNSQDEKNFLVSIIAKGVYEWMLHHPSKNLQLLFLIDEIAPFIPAGALKPAAKEILKMVFKQARKYGVGCVVATQNPGDIDYMAFSQFGSWAIGRLTTRQDQKKVEEALESISSEDVSTILPSLMPGNFLLFSPDSFKQTVRFESRWLYTEHTAITETEISKLMEGKKKPAVRPSPKKPVQKSKAAPATKEKPAVKKPQQTGPKILKLNVKDPAELVQGYVKQSLLGRQEEQVLSTTLELVPVYQLKVREDCTLLGIKLGTRTRTVLASAVTGNLINQNLEEHSLKLLYSFNEDQLMVYELIVRRKGISTQEIAYFLKIPAANVSRILTGLSQVKAVSYKKEGKTKRWYAVKKVRKTVLKGFDLTGISTEQYDDKAKKAKVKVREDDVVMMLKVWHSADVLDASIVYMPVYNVVLQSRDGERKLRVNGVTGKVY